MKWPVVLGGCVLLGAVVVLILPDEQPPAAVQPAIPAPEIAAAPERPTEAADTQGPGAIALYGVIYRGQDGAQSQALLSVDGMEEQVYRRGDQVTGQWSVQAIHPQEVVLSDGAKLVTIGVAAPAAATHGAAGAAAAMPTSAASAQPVPGFVSGPAPAAIDASAPERNRRFLQAVQGRRLATRQ